MVPARHFRVAVAGSGFGGLGTAIRLKQEGIDDFVVFERADRVGGVWRDNSYPGCACDVESLVYSFSFAPNPDWSRSYSPQAEILAYLEGCAERFGIGPHLRFHHEVKEAAWDEAAKVWRLETSQGPFTAEVLVAGVGALSEPSIPALPGLESFEGKIFHSARWDHGYPLEGKQVAVIGTGASAIQFVPAIQPRVGRMHVFQRTPPWILPRRDRALTDRERRLFRASPAAQRLARARIALFRELFVLGFINPTVMKMLERLARRQLRRQVPDPELQAKLTPSYRIGCKRILLSDDYLPAVSQPNVEVVTERIAEIGPRGIVTGDGQLREVDAIIFGTGFQVTDPPVGRHVRGRGGVTLTESWQRSPKAHLGTTFAGFPNLFMLQGPNTGLGHSSVIAIIESQIEHLLNALRSMERAGAAAIEPTEAAQAAWVREVDEKMRGTVWTSGGCASWYLDPTGRNSTLWPRSIPAFARRVEAFQPEEYVMVKRAAVEPSFRARAQQRVGSLLSRLPERVQLGLSGKRQIRVDGQALAPDVQLLLSLLERKRVKAIREYQPGELRRHMRRESWISAGPPVAVGRVRDLQVPGEAGLLPARHYAPAERSDALLVFFHGGGFVFGDVDTHDGFCRLLCRHAGVQVLSVEYRLAPEDPFPAAVEDARAAFAWAKAHASELGADPARVGIGGDSAGGTLSAVVSQLTAGSDHAPAIQLLIYPATDRTVPRPSLKLFSDGFFLTTADATWLLEQYAGTVDADPADPRISPLVARRLDGLPPALVVTAGFDPLRDEGEAYAEALRQAGTPVVAKRMENLVHGFINMAGISPSSRAAVLEMAADVRGLFETKQNAQSPVRDAMRMAG